MPRDIFLPSPPGTRRLVLWRHGRTAWNAVGRAQGHAPVPLDEVGRAEAARAAAMLAQYQPAFVWASDLARAQETATYLVSLLPDISLTLDKRLREYDVGLRQGLTITEFAAQHPAAYAAFVSGEEARVPGAELTSEVVVRMESVLRDAAAAVQMDQTGVLVGHGGSLRMGLLAFLGVPTENSEIIAGMANCAWTVLERRGRTPERGWQIIDYNARTLPEPVDVPDDPRG